MHLADYMREHSLSDTDIASAAGVSGEAVRLWRHGKRRISPETARKIEKQLGIPKCVLRPDLWSAAEAA
jgi:plasmid maintenance system antidote protein VapI